MTSYDTAAARIVYARLAGFMFLFVIVADFSAILIAARFEVPGNFAEAAHRIMAAEMLYRTGVCIGLIGSLGTVLLAMSLYAVLKSIDNNLALLALVFRLVEATLGAVQSIFSIIVLNLYLGADYIDAFNAKQLSVLVKLHSVASPAADISAIFFGAGSIIFFYLFLKSTYISRFLSVLGFSASVLVPIVSFAALISPQHATAIQLGWLPILVAELSVGLWLLFKGIRVRTAPEAGRPAHQAVTR